MPYAGVVLHKQNKYIEAFNSANAIDMEHAITLEEIDITRDSIFDKMVSIGVFIESKHGFFYMNADTAEKLKGNRSGFHLWRLD